MKGAVGGSGDPTLGSVLESLSQLEIADGNLDSEQDQSNLKKLEDRYLSFIFLASFLVRGIKCRSHLLQVFLIELGDRYMNP